MSPALPRTAAALSKRHLPALEKLSGSVLALDADLKRQGEPFAGLSPDRYLALRSEAHVAIVARCYEANIAELATMLLCASNYLVERLCETAEAEVVQ
jgi:hypothetical protein